MLLGWHNFFFFSLLLFVRQRATLVAAVVRGTLTPRSSVATVLWQPRAPFHVGGPESTARPLRCPLCNLAPYVPGKCAH